MSKHLLNAGCNAIAYCKNQRKYGMICAWACQIDYERIGMLIGEQSVTGNTLEVGDIVGLSALAKEQALVCERLGQNHSDKTDKFVDLDFVIDGNAVLFPHAKVMMKCKVESILKLNKESNDNFVVLSVISSDFDENKDFMSLSDVL